MQLPTAKDCGLDLGPGTLYAWSSNVHEQASMEANGYERTENKSGDYIMFIKGPYGAPKLAKKKATRKKTVLKSVPTSESDVNVLQESDDDPIA